MKIRQMGRIDLNEGKGNNEIQFSHHSIFRGSSQAHHRPHDHYDRFVGVVGGLAKHLA
jgi:hypothetical protein